MSSPLASRTEWGARPPRSGYSTIRNEGQTAHYGGPSPWGDADRSSPAAFAASTNHARCAPILRAYQAWHMDQNGWIDCGYNSAVCPHGHRYEIRGPGHRSAANGTNTGNARSCATVYIAGDGDPLTDQAKQAFYDEAVRFGVPLRWAHSDWKSTGCPGDPIRAWKAAGWALPTPPPKPPTPPEEDDIMPGTSAVARSDTSIDVFYVKDGRLRQKFWRSGKWSGPVDLGQPPKVTLHDSAPGVSVRHGGNSIDVFAIGSDGNLWQKYWRSGKKPAWSSWSNKGKA